MANNSVKIANLIGAAVAIDKKGVEQFLNKNMILVPAGISNEQLIKILINNLTNNESLTAKFIIWYKQQSDAYNNFVADTGNTTPSSTGSSFMSDFSFGSLTGLVGNIGSIWAGVEQSKNNRAAMEAQANANAQQAAAALAAQQNQAYLSQLQSQQALSGKTGNNTGLYVAIGIASVLAIGAIIFVATKK